MYIIGLPVWYHQFYITPKKKKLIFVSSIIPILIVSSSMVKETYVNEDTPALSATSIYENLMYIKIEMNLYI